jgi:hypothetical protein
MYLLYIFLPELHTRLRCSNFFNPSEKNSFGSAANRKSQRLISTPSQKGESADRILLETNGSSEEHGNEIWVSIIDEFL